MRAQSPDTTKCDGPARSDAPNRRWTAADAVRESSRTARVAGGIATVAAIACALRHDVPFASAVTVAVLIPAGLVDLIDRRLPDRLLAHAIAAGTVAAIVTFASGGSVNVLGSAMGAAAFAGPLLAMHLVVPTSMGFGDVKLGAVLGAAVGLVDPTLSLFALALGSFFGAVIGLIGRRRTIAFGPALIGGAIFALAVGAFPADVITFDDRPLEDTSP